MDVKPKLQATERSRSPRRQGQALLTSLCGLSLLTGVSIMSLLCLLQATTVNGQFVDKPGARTGPRNLMFRGWQKPELAILLSGQQYGYLQPCGCSRPQYGGLARRYDFMKSLERKGWPVVAVDLGDIAQKSGPLRSLKYQYAMKALHKMNYTAVGIGEREFNMPLIDALGVYRLNNPEPRILAANILTGETEKVIRDMVDGWHIVEDKQKRIPAVGIVGLVGRSVSDKVNDPDIVFAGAPGTKTDNATVLKHALSQLSGKAQVTVLIYQGTLHDAKAAAAYCARLHKANPRIRVPDVILRKAGKDESEPPSTPTTIKEAPNTLIISVGHKGRYVGVVGVFKTNLARRPYALKYQLVSVGPEYETPKGQEKTNPVMALMEDFAWAVKEGEYILKYQTVQHPVQVAFPGSKYVGSQRCERCHRHAHKIWSKVWDGKSHSHAFASLVKATRPSLRQYDPECVKCHVVGFEHPTGYGDALRNKNETRIGRLTDVGCESCHGPCSEHIRDRNNLKLRRLMNPWKATPEELDPKVALARRQQLRKKRLLKIDLFCQRCHDTDNDVHWNFEKKWPKIIHLTPRNAGNQPVNNGGQRPPQPVGNIRPQNPGAANLNIHRPQPSFQFPASAQPQFPSSSQSYPPQTQQQPQRQRRFSLNPFRLLRRRRD